MNVGIVGLGLIGGSLAKAYSAAGETVYGLDTDQVVLDFAKLSGAIKGRLDAGTLPECDLLLIALYTEAAIAYLEQTAPQIAKNTIVIDCCGTKRQICQVGFRLAAQYGFTYAGGHPMAGTQYSGFSHSREDLDQGQTMIIVPPEGAGIALLDRIKKLLQPAGFAHVNVATAEYHDKMIAYTSQLAHVVSNAFVKSPQAQYHRGYSAGSYKDLTRVAWLNEDMWTALFLENKDFLLEELLFLQDKLGEYVRALEAGDAPALKALLAEGRRCKERVDAQ